MLRVLGWIFGGLVLLLIAAVTVGYFTLKRPDIPYDTLRAQYAFEDSQWADLPGGIRMHYRDVGPADAPVVLLVHGFSASLHTWAPWMSALADEYRLVAIDLPGHGLTEAPEGYQANMESLTAAVTAFTQAQGLDRVAVVGSSMGGNVAWEYALAHPENTAGLVLVAASGWPDTREEVANDPPIFALMRNPIGAALLRDLDNSALARQGLEASFVNTSLVDDAMVGRYVEQARAPGHRDILLQLTLGFRERNYATTERLAPLASIPTLILHGRQDNLVPVEHGEQFAQTIPGSELVIWEDVGHIPQEEIAEASGQRLRTFLSDRVFTVTPDIGASLQNAPEPAPAP